MFYNETGFYESTLTAAELAYIDGLTPGTITANKAVVVDANKDIGDFNDVSLAGLTSSDLTASEIVISNASKKLVSAPVATYPSLTELSYVKGVTSAVQTQINAKAPIDAPTFTTSIGLTSGDITATNGNIVIGTSGKGIDFSATAGTGTSELLDDYEEGTFTPVSDGTATYTNQCGEYTLVGKVVTCSFNLIINAIGTGSPYYIWGFPFTAKNSSLTQAGTIGYGISMATNSTGLNCYISSNTTKATLTGQNGSAPTFETMALLGDSTQISGSITYIVE